MYVPQTICFCLRSQSSSIFHTIQSCQSSKRYLTAVFVFCPLQVLVMACFQGFPLPFQQMQYGSTKYHYHTRDGGPPLDCNTPSANPPTQPYTGPHGNQPGPPPGWICHQIVQPPSNPSPKWIYQQPTPLPPPFPAGPPCGPLPYGPPPGIYQGPVYPPPQGLAPGTYQGPVFPKPQEPGVPPGNRSNGRVVKADDGTGVLLSEDLTTFHVMEPGKWLSEDMSFVPNADFKVQAVDSDWTVKKMMRRLGALTKPRVDDTRRMPNGEKYNHELYVGIEQWLEEGDGKFRRATLIMYLDPLADKTLREVGWGPNHGKAGRDKPIWVMLYP